MRNEWISVRDRLPEDEYSSVITCNKAGYIELLGYSSVHKTWCDYETGYDVTRHGITHWMPLPAPPEV